MEVEQDYIIMSGRHEKIGDDVYYVHMVTLEEEKWGRLEEKDVSLFIHFLIESQTFVTLIYFSEWRVLLNYKVRS